MTVWLALVVAGGGLAAAPFLAAALIALRLARPYAFGAVVIGLLVAGGAAAWRRRRSAIGPALAIAAALVATEAFFLVVGFPNIAGMAVGYAPKRVMFRERRPFAGFAETGAALSSSAACSAAPEPAERSRINSVLRSGSSVRRCPPTRPDF